MCGQPQNETTADDDTWRLRGLTTEDVSAASSRLPQMELTQKRWLLVA